MRFAIIQSRVTPDKQDNVRRAVEALERARGEGADIAALPEMFCCPYSNRCFPQYAEGEDGFVQSALAGAAARLGMTVVGGSFPEREGERIYNTSCVYGPDGRRLAKHRKVHLFDIDVEGGQRFFESDTLSPGGEITTFSACGCTFGLCICFDMRFEELARVMTLEGARVIVVPAAFNMTTGPAHWELLFRQRAVDNQVYTLGIAPARDEAGEYVSYANSIAVSPWGDVVARCGAEECLKVVELDLERVDAVRRQLPILSARRTDLYTVART